MLRRVLKPHEPIYDDPITIAAGDALRLTGQEELWEGHRWLWAVAADGREGWVPDDLASATAGDIRATRDYTAAELRVEVGDALDVLAQTHGWSWCRHADRGEGWVPDACLDVP